MSHLHPRPGAQFDQRTRDWSPYQRFMACREASRYQWNTVRDSWFAIQSDLRRGQWSRTDGVDIPLDKEITLVDEEGEVHQKYPSPTELMKEVTEVCQAANHILEVADLDPKGAAALLMGDATLSQYDRGLYCLIFPGLTTHKEGWPIYSYFRGLGGVLNSLMRFVGSEGLSPYVPANCVDEIVGSLNEVTIEGIPMEILNSSEIQEEWATSRKVWVERSTALLTEILDAVKTDGDIPGAWQSIYEEDHQERSQAIARYDEEAKVTLNDFKALTMLLIAVPSSLR